jgi:hypothetical protein
MWLLSLPMESTLGMILFFGTPFLFVAGIALMWRRSTAEEVAEGVVRKDLIGSVVVFGALALLIGVCFVVWRFVL